VSHASPVRIGAAGIRGLLSRACLAAHALRACCYWRAARPRLQIRDALRRVGLAPILDGTGPYVLHAGGSPRGCCGGPG